MDFQGHPGKKIKVGMKEILNFQQDKIGIGLEAKQRLKHGCRQLTVFCFLLAMGRKADAPGIHHHSCDIPQNSN